MKKYIKPEIKISKFNEFIITSGEPVVTPTPTPAPSAAITHTKNVANITSDMQTKVDFQSALGYR